ncbi:hypothetical protein [Acidiphilium iwatense]|uniref:Uncharacterized protein n=1 Tax=Acidiphilium iwatense TaxID=768198 RepID=A0ABS9DSE2_9PROT|nr:hypothetical protein [Acidiphilium iwatense]MCF3945594.1 hypothetical protein [Acidiphilium iwatense]
MAVVTAWPLHRHDRHTDGREALAEKSPTEHGSASDRNSASFKAAGDPVTAKPLALRASAEVSARLVIVHAISPAAEAFSIFTTVSPDCRSRHPHSRSTSSNIRKSQHRPDFPKVFDFRRAGSAIVSSHSVLYRTAKEVQARHELKEVIDV